MYIYLYVYMCVCVYIYYTLHIFSYLSFLNSKKKENINIFFLWQKRNKKKIEHILINSYWLLNVYSTISAVDLNILLSWETYI